MPPTRRRRRRRYQNGQASPSRILPAVVTAAWPSPRFARGLYIARETAGVATTMPSTSIHPRASPPSPSGMLRPTLPRRQGRTPGTGRSARRGIKGVWPPSLPALVSRQTSLRRLSDAAKRDGQHPRHHLACPVGDTRLPGRRCTLAGGGVVTAAALPSAMTEGMVQGRRASGASSRRGRVTDADQGAIPAKVARESSVSGHPSGSAPSSPWRLQNPRGDATSPGSARAAP